jgi:Family of unknown function (DUF6356)
MIKESREHLKETGWTYKQHLMHSITQSNKLLVIALKSYIHGFFPSLYKADGPISIIKMYHKIMRIQHIYKINKQLKDDGEI